VTVTEFRTILILLFVRPQAVETMSYRSVKASHDLATCTEAMAAMPFIGFEVQVLFQPAKWSLSQAQNSVYRFAFAWFSGHRVTVVFLVLVNNS